jgi:hypothetical protein
MPATGPGSEHFGWARIYEEPEQYWEERERSDRDALKDLLRKAEARREARVQQAVRETLHILRERGLLREDRLSYTRICQLEHETGIFAGSWTEYLNALHEAELKDREIWKSTT